jgi:chromosome segregation ATPase
MQQIHLCRQEEEKTIQKERMYTLHALDAQIHTLQQQWTKCRDRLDWIQLQTILKQEHDWSVLRQKWDDYRSQWNKFYIVPEYERRQKQLEEWETQYELYESFKKVWQEKKVAFSFEKEKYQQFQEKWQEENEIHIHNRELDIQIETMRQKIDSVQKQYDTCSETLVRLETEFSHRQIQFEQRQKDWNAHQEMMSELEFEKALSGNDIRNLPTWGEPNGWSCQVMEWQRRDATRYKGKNTLCTSIKGLNTYIILLTYNTYKFVI